MSAITEQMKLSWDTGVFISRIPYNVTRLSKSKLNSFLSCPRAYWYSQILLKPVEFSIESELNFARGTYVHSVHEYFYRAMANNAPVLLQHGVDFIELAFEKYLDGSEYEMYVRGIMDWEIKKWNFYLDSVDDLTCDILHYFLPAKYTDGSLAVERKIYSEKLDWVTVCDSVFWVPPSPKDKIQKDQLMIVDDKSGKHKPNYYTALRVELTFMKRVLESTKLVEKPPMYGAIYYPLSNDMMKVKFGKRQETALNDRLAKLDYSIKHDHWPCNPIPDWACNWCPHNTVCPMDFQSHEYRFPPELEVE